MANNPQANLGKRNFIKTAAIFVFRPFIRQKALNWKKPEEIVKHFEKEQEKLEQTEEYEKLQMVLRAIEQEEDDADAAEKKHDLGTLDFEKYFKVHNDENVEEHGNGHGHGQIKQTGKVVERQGTIETIHSNSEKGLQTVLPGWPAG
jgi:hypothetical protein